MLSWIDAGIEGVGVNDISTCEASLTLIRGELLLFGLIRKILMSIDSDINSASINSNNCYIS